MNNATSTLNLQITGDGTQVITGAKNYTGTTTLAGGTLSVNTLANGGTASSIGASSSTADKLVFSGGALKYTGANIAINRTFTIHAGKTATIETTSGLTLAGATGTAASGSINKKGGGMLTLTGANTYTGDTTISDGILQLSDNAQLRFVIGAVSGSNNVLSGAGTAVINGDFVIDTTAAAALTSGSWVLENVASLTGAYGGSFTVSGFTDIGGDKWSMDGGGGRSWSFDETTGTLVLASGLGNPYSAWIDSPAYNTPALTASMRLPDSDPDGDGSSNILEFAINGNPVDPSDNGMIASLVQGSGTPAGNEFTLIVAVRDGATFAGGATATISGITYTVEGSLDLAFPDSAVSSSGPFDLAPASTGLPSLAGTGWEFHAFKLNVSEGLGDKGFLRLKVAKP